MTLLYLVAESEADAEFYASCAERLTGRDFQRHLTRSRKGDGVNAVKRLLECTLRVAQGTASGNTSVAFIAGMDNDRAPHPENTRKPPEGTGLERSKLSSGERKQADRSAWMLEMVESVLTPDRRQWTLEVALALPVEMLESWLVRALRESPPQPMPHFSHSDSQGAREYYAEATGTCPPQWKDLVEEEREALARKRNRHVTNREFLHHVILHLEVEALAQRSWSFRMFKEWLDGWKHA